MRSVDLEAAGSPSAEQVSSRVSYMRVPEFFGDLFREEAAANNRSIVLLLFLQKQNLANAIYLFGLGTLLSGLGSKHMRIRSHHDLAGTLVTPYSFTVTLLWG
jgi:hypothetical protein